MLPLRRRARRGAAVAALTLATALTAAACSGSSDAGDTTLVLYNAQHEDLSQAEVDAFTAQTGIAVELRNGDDSELGNQIVAEGDASPADVFVTENSPAMSLVAGAGLLAPVDAATRAQVPAQYQAADGSWVGWAARATVLPYDTRALTEDQLPASVLDLADPAWAGKVGISPGGADFQAIVSAVLQLRGEEATARWLAGLKSNARIYQGNNAVLKAVNSGEVQTGIIYHYYWYKDQAGGAPNTANVALKFLGDQDPGAFVSVSGAGVLASSAHPAQAQQLVAFLTSTQGQEVSAQSTNLEYTVASGVPSNPALRPLAELGAPVVDVTALNGPKVVELMRGAGLI
ncbi:iron ABC transporter substrate-binding protein [Rhodococcus aerolatus]